MFSFWPELRGFLHLNPPPKGSYQDLVKIWKDSCHSFKATRGQIDDAYKRGINRASGDLPKYIRTSTDLWIVSFGRLRLGSDRSEQEIHEYFVQSWRTAHFAHVKANEEFYVYCGADNWVKAWVDFNGSIHFTL